jgi:hypothetical protein
MKSPDSPPPPLYVRHNEGSEAGFELQYDSLGDRRMPRLGRSSLIMEQLFNAEEAVAVMHINRIRFNPFH